MDKRPETWESPWIASAIKATGDLEARKEMLRFTKDQSDPFRRAAYLEALGILGGDEIREFLMEEIKSPEPAVAYSAAYGLSQLKDPVTDAILQNLIAGSDAGLAKAAQDAVWRRRDERSR
jgi:HEAT repeat protein